MRDVDVAKPAEPPLVAKIAHDISNALGVLGAEHTYLADEINDLTLSDEVRSRLLETLERCQRQIARCGEGCRRLQQSSDTSKAI